MIANLPDAMIVIEELTQELESARKRASIYREALIGVMTFLIAAHDKDMIANNVEICKEFVKQALNIEVK